ncbi:MAG TPA: hypothetical protein EYH34_14365 [Planctomycetes bacterium]|nr:hypothetical protein [Planctomycetota bacterium]
MVLHRSGLGRQVGSFAHRPQSEIVLRFVQQTHAHKQTGFPSERVRLKGHFSLFDALLVPSRIQASVGTLSELDERGRRRRAAVEVGSLGWGGITAVAPATGISDRTIRHGIRAPEGPETLPPDRQRRPGEGRRSQEEEQPGLIEALERPIEPTTRGDPVRLKCHDFPGKKLGKAVPYGVYDLAMNEAGVSVGIGHDTAQFAVASIRRWWQRLGQQRYGKRNTFHGGWNYKIHPRQHSRIRWAFVVQVLGITPSTPTSTVSPGKQGFRGVPPPMGGIIEIVRL